MRNLVLVTSAVLTIAACSYGDQPGNGDDSLTTDADRGAADNMTTDPAMNGATMNRNTVVDGATQNMMMQDMNTNTPDTKLANGM